MKRHEFSDLLLWQSSSQRKPLLLHGARQVGKTWLMKEFGQAHYSNIAYVNFENNKRLSSVFENDFQISRIIQALEIETGIRIDPANTLIIFDEIQEVPAALTSLKYFYENAPQYHIMAAGSLLGVALHRQSSFPVGKVDFLDLHPLSFYEFLEAIGESALLNVLNNHDWEMAKVFKSKYIHLLRTYYFTGGMPEVVESFRLNGDFSKVRSIQQNILLAYEQDFSKHAPYEIVPRIRMIWNSIPSQLAKENKKFIYGHIKTGSRARDYVLALSWLHDCGLVHKICRITKPGLPLKAYEDLHSFKLFLSDVGLLGAMSNLDIRSLLEGNDFFEEFKGALTEQYVLQQLISQPALNIYYWSNERSAGEIDFVVQNGDHIIAVEVKAAENLHAKSLRAFSEKYQHHFSIRTSLSDYRKQEWMTNLPLYAIRELTRLSNEPTQYWRDRYE